MVTLAAAALLAQATAPHAQELEWVRSAGGAAGDPGARCEVERQSPPPQCLAIAAAAPRRARAEAVFVGGEFTASAATPLSCSGVVCFATNFSGSLEGPAEHSLTLMLPTDPLGVAFFKLLTVIHTARGDLSCTESGASNIGPSANGEPLAALGVLPNSDGQFALLCQITGGTGDFAGATGYLLRTGTSSGGLPGILPGILPSAPTSGRGGYRGKVVEQ